MFVWLTGSDTKPPVLLSVRCSKIFIQSTVIAAIFTDIFLYGIVVPVLPFALTGRAGVAPDEVQQWTSILIAVYGAALLASSPFFGWLADRTNSRRAPMLSGLLAQTGSTVMLTVGNRLPVLVVGRILQGISAAVVWTVGLVLLVDTYGTAKLAVVMGNIAVSMSLAFLLAPLLGGIVFDKAGYYAVFYMAFALLAMDIVMRLALIERKTARRWLPDLDSEDSDPGEVSAPENGELEKASAARDHSDRASRSPSTLDGQEDIIGAASNNSGAPTTINREKSSKHAEASLSDSMPKTKVIPMLALLKSRRFAASLFSSVIQATLLTSFDSILPIFVRNTFGWNSIGAGLIFLPLVVPTLFSPFFGYFNDKYPRYTPRLFSSFSFLCATPLFILLRLVDHDSIQQKVLLCALLTLLGLALSLALLPAMAETSYATSAVTKRSPPGAMGKHGAYAQAYGLFNVAFAAGSVIGPLLGGLISRAVGFKTATLVLGLVSSLAVPSTLYFTGGRLFVKTKDGEGRTRWVMGIGKGGDKRVDS